LRVIAANIWAVSAVSAPSTTMPVMAAAASRSDEDARHGPIGTCVASQSKSAGGLYGFEPSAARRSFEPGQRLLRPGLRTRSS
jgi:hypothetical protein